MGRKARGLSLIPPAWRPPFAVATADLYDFWKREEAKRGAVIAIAAESVEAISKAWRHDWPRGLILRSSAENETLDDRGANVSLRLAADFDQSQIAEALESIFNSFSTRASPGRFAAVIQPLANEGPLGHLSNERRVSKTVNQWRWERSLPEAGFGHFNSWRDRPDVSTPLVSTGKPRNLNRVFGAVGRWITDLHKGPAHLEWIFDGQKLWLLQLDFEYERPDDGVDPKEWLRQINHHPSGKPSQTSTLTLVDLDPDKPPSIWRKVENVRRFAAARREAYPPLVTITGERLRKVTRGKPNSLKADLEAFAHGRVVCRTDCNTPGMKRENLPRTSTVSTDSAIKHMAKFLEQMIAAGAKDAEVCFIAHQFIPAQSGAWARADPNSPVVRIDALWGVPDGLQYLPHDTYDVDVVRKAVSAERLRYKPRFIQETTDGSWQELKVKRSFGRTRSLSSTDAISIALTSHDIVKRAGKPQMIMWFCGIPSELGIGRNLPWFSMPPNPTPTLVGETGAPRWPRITLRTLDDVDSALATGARRNIVVLEPEIVLFRDNTFIERVIELAKRDNCPVQMAGSTLAHAHYQLEKAGVSVVTEENLNRTRVRGRRTFAKLVRDEMPAQIASRGEVVVHSRLPRSEMRRALVAKLLEEAQELLSATDPDDVKAELADLLEVVRAMAGITGVAWAEVETAANDKRQSRGGFDEGAVLVGTEWPTAERSIQRMPQIVTLRGLGKVVSGPEQGSASYNALLASKDGLVLEVGRRQFSVRMTRDGISIQAVGAGFGLARQLELPLEDETDAAGATKKAGK